MKTMRKLFLTYLLLFLFTCLFAQTEQANYSPACQYQVNGSINSIQLPAIEWMLEEGETPLNPDALQKGNFEGRKNLTPDKNQFFRLEAHRNYWFPLRFISKTGTDSLGLVFLRYGNVWPWEFTFKDVEGHYFRNGKKDRIAYSGSAAPYSKRDYPEKIDPSLIWFDLEAGDTLDIWIKLNSAEAISVEIQLVLEDHRVAKGPTPADFVYTSHYILNGAGLALLMLALALYIWFREPIYLWFMIFQGVLILHHFGMIYHNELFISFFKEYPRTQVLGSTFISLLMILSLVQFGRVYIGTKAKFLKTHTLLSFCMALFALSAFIGIYSRIYDSGLADLFFMFRPILIGGAFVIMFISLISLLFMKDRLARVFSSGISLYVIFSLGRLVFINISPNPGEERTMIFNHFFLIITTTIILGYRFVLITQEKNTAHAEKIASDLEQLKQKQIAEQKTKEAERLEELERIKSNFFSNITHEFRTPLTLIIEPLRQVLEQPDQPWVNKVELAKTNSQKLLRLINQLLDFSKLEYNQMRIELKQGDIMEAIRPLLDSFALLAEEKNIKLSHQITGAIKHFDFDKDKIEKIISNLISNAIKFTEPNGNINISIQSEEQLGKPYFNFKIKDSGIGIPEKEQAHVFDRFYQVDGSNTRKYQGTGIGLALCKELVELMNGNISLKSQPGKGSTFEFSIPMYFESIEKINTTIKPAANLVPFSAKAEVRPHDGVDMEADNIALVIEDNAELRQFIVSSIEGDYQVIEASNGKEGLEKAIEYIPNIIVSDVMMPEMNGFEVCEKVKTNEKTAHIPVILLTAKTAFDSRIQGLEFGADAYMNKPFHTKELLLRMKNLIEIRLLLQKKYSQEIEGESLENAVPNNVISRYDKQFLENIDIFISEKMEEDSLGVEDIAQAMGMSRTQLFRKTKALLNQSPSELLRNLRLKAARKLLQEKEGNVSEIAYRVGFSSQKYFSTKFKEKYGKSPSTLYNK